MLGTVDCCSGSTGAKLERAGDTGGLCPPRTAASAALALGEETEGGAVADATISPTSKGPGLPSSSRHWGGEVP